MTATDRAWAAGMFESRGSIVINKTSDRSLILRCMLVGIDKSIPEFFQQNWPGSMNPISRPKGNLPQWKWVVTGGGAEAFLKDISSFFRTAQAIAKAKLALDFQSVKARGTDHAALQMYYQKMGDINAYKRKGVR